MPTHFRICVYLAMLWNLIARYAMRFIHFDISFLFFILDEYCLTCKYNVVCCTHSIMNFDISPSTVKCTIYSYTVQHDPVYNSYVMPNQKIYSYWTSLTYNLSLLWWAHIRSLQDISDACLQTSIET